MITIIILIVVCISIAVLLTCLGGGARIYEKVFSVFFGMLMGFMIGGAIAFMIPSDGEKVIAKTYNLAALQDGNSIKGNFMLGCGYIDGSMKYAFYYKENGEYRLQTIDCQDAVVVYECGHPKIEEYTMKRTETKHNRWTVGDPRLSGEKYKIFVPEGTIKFELTLDAK